LHEHVPCICGKGENLVCTNSRLFEPHANCSNFYRYNNKIRAKGFCECGYHENTNLTGSGDHSCYRAKILFEKYELFKELQKYINKVENNELDDFKPKNKKDGVQTRGAEKRKLNE